MTNILFWTFTGLFRGFMLLSAIAFLGVAKALGVIAIAVPVFPGIKQRAYAGFSLIYRRYCTPIFVLKG